jgi:hypothetical protein
LELLLNTFAFAIAPATFLRLAEHRNDTFRVLHVASSMIGTALLPFAMALGLSFFVVGELTGNHMAAVIAGACGFTGAIGMWYAAVGASSPRTRPDPSGLAPTTLKPATRDRDAKGPDLIGRAAPFAHRV